MEKIRASIAGREDNGAYIYSCSLQIIAGVGIPTGPYQVCKLAYLFCWRISEHHYKRIIKVFKESDDGHLATSAGRPLNDTSTVYKDFSSDDVAAAYEENIVIIVDGERILIPRAGKLFEKTFKAFVSIDYWL